MRFAVALAYIVATGGFPVSRADGRGSVIEQYGAEDNIREESLHVHGEPKIVWTTTTTTTTNQRSGPLVNTIQEPLKNQSSSYEKCDLSQIDLGILSSALCPKENQFCVDPRSVGQEKGETSRTMGICIDPDDFSEFQQHPQDHRDLQTYCDTLCPNARPAVTKNGVDLNDQIYYCSTNSNNCEYDQDIKCWDVSGIIDMTEAFYRIEFNDSLDCWDTGNVESMKEMFRNSKFNNKVSSWNVKKVTTMEGMFQKSEFNQDISPWDVRKVASFYSMFEESVFNSNIFTVTNGPGNSGASSRTMQNMFSKNVVFNQYINGWEMDRVTTTNRMFAYASAFNQDVGSWDVKGVEDFERMFMMATSFNAGNVNSWKPSSADTVESMFDGATNFNQCLESWAAKTSDTVYTKRMFENTACPDPTDPDPTVGPWCQNAANGCTVVPITTDYCNDDSLFCSKFDGMKNRKLRKKCGLQAVRDKCPKLCNNKTKFKIPGKKGKKKCKKIPKQVSCNDVDTKGVSVSDLCPKKCKCVK